MDEFVKVFFRYIEKIVSPLQLWFIIWIVCSFIIFTSKEYLEPLALETWAIKYKPFFSIGFIFSSAVLTARAISFLAPLLGGTISSFFHRVALSDVGDEARAILYFLHSLDKDGVSFKSNHPAILALIKQGLIHAPPMSVYVLDEHDYLELTKIGKAFLRRHHTDLKDQFPNQESLLTFINMVSRDPFKPHTPHEF